MRTKKTPFRFDLDFAKEHVNSSYIAGRTTKLFRLNRLYRTKKDIRRLCLDLPLVHEAKIIEVNNAQLIDVNNDLAYFSCHSAWRFNETLPVRFSTVRYSVQDPKNVTDIPSKAAHRRFRNYVSIFPAVANCMYKVLDMEEVELLELTIGEQI